MAARNIHHQYRELASRVPPLSAQLQSLLHDLPLSPTIAYSGDHRKLKIPRNSISQRIIIGRNVSVQRDNSEIFIYRGMRNPIGAAYCLTARSIRLTRSVELDWRYYP